MDDDAFWAQEAGDVDAEITANAGAELERRVIQQALEVESEAAEERAAIQHESTLATRDGTPGEELGQQAMAIAAFDASASAVAQQAADREPEFLWVDLKTGEIVDEGTKGAVRVEPADLAATEFSTDADDCFWLPDYYTKRLSTWAAEERMLERQHRRRLGQLRADRCAFEYYYHDRIRVEVKAALVPLKRKTIDFTHGRLGFRAMPGKFEIENKEEVLAWAIKNAPAAVKQIPATVDLLKSGLPKGESVPGAKWLLPWSKFTDDCIGKEAK